MAIRKIVLTGNDILKKVCKPVKVITPRMVTLAEDMIDTMLDADGVGLAAPQVGVMKRLFVAMPYPEDEEPEVYVMFNPEIIEKEGEQASNEGCLSIPGYMGSVKRPEMVKIKYTDIDGEEKIDQFEGFGAVVICHEYDHLDGILYSDIADTFMTNEEYLEMLEAENEAESENEAEAGTGDISENQAPDLAEEQA